MEATFKERKTLRGNPFLLITPSTWLFQRYHLQHADMVSLWSKDITCAWFPGPSRWGGGDVRQDGRLEAWTFYKPSWYIWSISVSANKRSSFLILHSTVLSCKNNLQRSTILFNHFPISVPRRQILGSGIQNDSVSVTLDNWSVDFFTQSTLWSW